MGRRLGVATIQTRLTTWMDHKSMGVDTSREVRVLEASEANATIEGRLVHCWGNVVEEPLR